MTASGLTPSYSAGSPEASPDSAPSASSTSFRSFHNMSSSSSLRFNLAGMEVVDCLSALGYSSEWLGDLSVLGWYAELLCCPTTHLCSDEVLHGLSELGQMAEVLRGPLSHICPLELVDAHSIEWAWKDPLWLFNDHCEPAKEDRGTELRPFSDDGSLNAHEKVNWETSRSSNSQSKLWWFGVEDIQVVERDDVDWWNWTNADLFPPTVPPAAGNCWWKGWDMQYKIYVHSPFYF